MNWTTEQNAAFDFFATGEGNAIFEAFAGSGKTTTIVQAFSEAPESKILYAVFNKKNQIEAEGKVRDSRVSVKTLHSVGLWYLKKVWGNGLKADKNLDYERSQSAAGILANDKEAIGLIARLVGFLKNETIAPTKEQAYEVAEVRECLAGEQRKNDLIVDAALAVLEASKQRDAEGRISFNDMVWLPVALDIVTPYFDLVCIDEAQDMNLPQLTMARSAAKGRIIVVGDRNQAIYGFRGAASGGMSMMQSTLSAQAFGLTVSQRCAKAIAAEAANIVPNFKATETAPDGKVEYVRDAFSAVVGDAILSRTNAPIMPLALQFLRKDIPARIEGRDLGEQLLNMIRGFRASSVEELIGKIRQWEEKQCARAAINAKGNDERIAKKCEQFHDIAESLITLTENLDTVEQVQARIDNLFQDTNGQSKPAVVLSTVHKAKGLEWNRVFILNDTFGKNKKADASEERNVRYVAITRARQELYYVGGSQPVPAPVKPVAVAQPVPALPVAKPAPASKPALPARKLKAKSVAEICAAVEVAAQKLDAQHHKMDDYKLAQGQTYCKVGDVQLISGDEYVCTMVNKSRSRWQCLVRKSKTATMRAFGKDGVTEKEVTFKQARETMDLSASRDVSQAILRRMSADELQTFLNGGARAVRERNENKQSDSTERNPNMPKTKSGEVSYAGRGDYIRKLKADGVKRGDLMEKVKAKYPGSSSGKCLAVFDGKSKARKTLAPATTAAKKKSTPPPAPKKKASAKAAPKAPAPKAKKKVTTAAKAPTTEAPDVAAAPVPPPPAPRKVEVQAEAPAAEPTAESDQAPA
jgi:DNA helicase-2/ATP-dependent DNA helicase PcrA